MWSTGSTTGISLETMKTLTHKDTRTPAFTATLFTIAKLRKQPECPLADKRIKRAWNTNAAEQTLGYAKRAMLPSAATWMGLETSTCLAKPKTNTVWSRTCGIQKNNTNNCICKTENTDIENKPVVAKCKKEVKGIVAQSCLTLCHPTDCTSPGSSVHEIFQARKLEGVAISSSLAYLKSLSRVRLFVTPWTVQSVKFSRPEYWSG